MALCWDLLLLIDWGWWGKGGKKSAKAIHCPARWLPVSALRWVMAVQPPLLSSDLSNPDSQFCPRKCCSGSLLAPLLYGFSIKRSLGQEVRSLWSVWKRILWCRCEKKKNRLKLRLTEPTWRGYCIRCSSGQWGFVSMEISLEESSLPPGIFLVGRAFPPFRRSSIPLTQITYSLRFLLETQISYHLEPCWFVVQGGRLQCQGRKKRHSTPEANYCRMKWQSWVQSEVCRGSVTWSTSCLTSTGDCYWIWNVQWPTVWFYGLLTIGVQSIQFDYAKWHLNEKLIIVNI